ncbi:MAG: hypothetical protein R2912_10025 [Eubacteriales bacterium]
METDVLIIAAGNGTHFGGGMMVTPKADPFDGLLDICVIHGLSKLKAYLILPKFMKGEHLTTKYVTYFTASELTAVCEPLRCWMWTETYCRERRLHLRFYRSRFG